MNKFKWKGLFLPWLILIIFFSLTVVLPLVGIFLTPKANDFVSVFSSPRFYDVLKNTFLECICSTILAVLTGYIFAFAVVKTNIPGKKILSLIPIIHLVTPPFVGGLSFILLFGRRGFFTHRLFGLDVSLYGFWGLLIAQCLCFFPVSYLICLQTLKNINSSIEDVALSLGSSKLKIFFTVTLPLSFHGILSAFLFIMVSVLSDFGNPLIVAGRYRVLAVEIYSQLTGWLNTGEGAVLGFVLVVPSVVLFVLQNRITKSINLKNATIDGNSGALNTVSFIPEKNSFKTGNCSKVSFSAGIFIFIFCTLISLLVAAQLIAIIAGSFQKLWGIDITFTLNHVKSLVYHISPLVNSIIFALIAAILSTFIAFVAAFLSNRANVPYAKILDSVCQIPSAVPGTLYGISLSLFAAKLKIPLSSVSQILIIIAMTTSFLPFSYRILVSTMSQIHTTLDDSALSLGDSKIKFLFKVLSKICSGGIFSAFVYDFIRGIGTLSSVIFLVSFHTPLASVTIVNLAEQGSWGSACAMALALTLITFSVLAVVRLISKIYQRFLDQTAFRG